jgi:hypothetical protein
MIEGKRLTAATISRSENHVADYLSSHLFLCVVYPFFVGSFIVSSSSERSVGYYDFIASR